MSRCFWPVLLTARPAAAGAAPDERTGLTSKGNAYPSRDTRSCSTSASVAANPPECCAKPGPMTTGRATVHE